MFHTEEISGNPLGSRRTLSAPILLAAGLHAAAALLILGARTWTVDEPPEPPIPVIFSDWQRAPLGDESRGPATTRKSPADQRPAASFVPTDQAADRGPFRLEDPVGDEDGARDTSTGTPGRPDGVPFGTGDPDSIAGVERGAPEAADIVRVGGDVKAPLLLFRVDPAYSEAARTLHAEGVVVLEAVISGTGAVENVRVLRSAHPLLDAAAVRAVGEWRYQPATLNGRAVRVYLTVTVSFALRG